MWPDVGTQSSPNSSKSCQKVTFLIRLQCFSKYPKRDEIFGLLFIQKLSPRTIKNCPIWSHWTGYSKFPEAKEGSCLWQVSRSSIRASAIFFQEKRSRSFKCKFVLTSVTRFGAFLPLWQNLKSLWQILHAIWAVLRWWISTKIEEQSSHLVTLPVTNVVDKF